MTTIRRIAWGAAMVAAIILSGCGGGSGGSSGSDAATYSGSTSAATVSDGNARSIATASSEGTKSATELGAADAARSGQQAAPADLLTSLSMRLLGSDGNPRSTAGTRLTYDPVPGDCGGSATVTVDDASTESSGSGSIVYDNFCVAGLAPDSGNLVVNGRVTFSYTSTTYTFTYHNVTLSYGGETHTINMTVSCNDVECTMSSDFQGSDGRTYRIAHISVAGDNTSGYAIEGRVYHPDHGYVEISASGISICDNGNIGSGTIAVRDSTGTEALRLDFPGDCSTVVATRNGVSEIYSQ